MSALLRSIASTVAELENSDVAEKQETINNLHGTLIVIRDQANFIAGRISTLAKGVIARRGTHEEKLECEIAHAQLTSLRKMAEGALKGKYVNPDDY